MRSETPRNVLKYTVRSEKGKFVLSANTGSERRKKSVLSASTDDERLDSAVRLASIVAGLFLVLLGFGGAGLAVYGIRQGGISALFELLAVILFMPVVGLYGIDLVGRGILGRKWSRRYWISGPGRYSGSGRGSSSGTGRSRCSSSSAGPSSERSSRSGSRVLPP